MLKILLAVIFVMVGPISVRADEIGERRQNLLSLSLSIDDFEAKKIDIRCPIYMASVDGFLCLVVNSSSQTVGTLYVVSRKLPSEVKMTIVEKCASNTEIGADCVANLRVSVDGGMVYADILTWVPST